MKKLKFFIYDNVLDLYDDSIKIYYFNYNSKTTIWDLYKFIAQKYVELNIKNFKSVKDVIEILCFSTIGLPNNVEISSETGIYTIEELFLNNTNKLICIQALHPIGGVVARYKNYKIVINSNEANHKGTPHVHIWSPLGDDIFFYLTTFKYKGEFNDNNAKKKIVKYIKENQEYLINLYNHIVNNEIIEKQIIDFIM